MEDFAAVLFFFAIAALNLFAILPASRQFQKQSVDITGYVWNERCSSSHAM